MEQKLEYLQDFKAETQCPSQEKLNALSITAFPEKISDKSKKKEICYRIANDITTRKEAFRLVYDVYRTMNYSHKVPSRMWYTLYELLENSITFVAMHENEVIAAISVTNDGDLGLPSDDDYKEEIDQLREKGYILSEYFSFAIRPDMRGNIRLKMRLLNLCYLSCRYILGTTHAIITVVPKHVDIYHEKFLFDILTDKKYFEKTMVDCVLMSIDNDTVIKNQSNKNSLYQYFIPQAQEKETVGILEDIVLPICIEDFRYFIGTRPDIYLQASGNKKSYIDNKNS